MAKKYFWFKQQEDFFKSKEIKKLRKIAGGDTYTIIYQKMILLSIRTEGRIMFDGIEDSFAEEIALEIDEEPDNVKVTIGFITKLGLVDVMSDNEIVMKETIKNVGTQDESTERVRLHRERKKALLPLHVTNETTEIEKNREEIEIDITPFNKQCNDIFTRTYFKYYGEEYPRRIKNIDWHISIREQMKPDEFTEAIIEFFETYPSFSDKCTAEYFNSMMPKYNSGAGF